MTSALEKVIKNIDELGQAFWDCGIILENDKIKSNELIYVRKKHLFT